MKEQHRDGRAFRWIEDTWRDARYAFRMLRRDKGLASIAVITLALGIGANTALFSVIDALMLRRLPVTNPDELRLFTIARSTPIPGVSFSYPLYEDFQTKADAFSGVIAVGNVNPMRVGMGGDGSGTEVARAQGVSGNFFSVLNLGAAAGRVLVPGDDDVTGPVAAAVLSDGFWARRFGRDPSVVGRRITINDVPFTIVGVAPARFSRCRGRRRSGHLVAQSFDATSAECSTRPDEPAERVELAHHRPAAAGGRRGTRSGTGERALSDRSGRAAGTAPHPSHDPERPPCVHRAVRAPRVGGRRLDEPSLGVRTAAARADDRRRAGPARRVRQRRESAAGARGGAAKGDRRSYGPRLRTESPGQATRDGERVARRARRHSWSRCGAVSEAG